MVREIPERKGSVLEALRVTTMYVAESEFEKKRVVFLTKMQTFVEGTIAGQLR